MTSKSMEKSTPVESPVLPYTPEQAREMVATVESTRVAGRDAVIAASKVTHAVITGGFVGKGRVWETQGDYATALGVSGGTISGLLALGTAISLGLGVEHPAFEAVYAKRQSLGKVAKGAKRLSTITAEAKRLAKSPAREVTPASEKVAETPASEYDAVVAALDVIRENLATMTADQSRAIRSSLVTLADAAGTHAKMAAAAEKAAEREAAESVA